MKKFSLGLFPILSICLLALPATANMVPQRSVLGNGMILLTSEQRALPMVSIELLIDAGSRHDAPKQEGLGQLNRQALDLRDAAPDRAANQRYLGFYRRRPFRGLR